MKFTVGYQIDHREMLVREILAKKDRISEVYFAFGDLPNGRHRATRNAFLSPDEARERQLSELETISNAGIPLNLLLNASCYGKNSLSRDFYEQIGDTVDYLASLFSLNSITTTSPIIAKFIKNNFPSLKIRASVNMEINGEFAMEYLSEYFDSFYLRRELNRNMAEILKAKKWCDEKGKKLYMLANSGCLSYCPLHNFHDNLVSHEEQIMKKDNAFSFSPICKERIGGKEGAAALLRETNFVRPEDMGLYEGLFEAAKLATRVSTNPAQIVHAYTEGHYTGNIAELLEPDHAAALDPYILENRRLPPDFGKKLLYCEKNCNECGYCEKAAKDALVKLDKGVYVYANQSDD